MPGRPLRLGPFVGGLNTGSDQTAVADSELTDVVNFELDIDGSLVSRPPIQSTIDMNATWTERIVLLGVGVFSSGNYLIGSNTNGIFQFNSGVWTQIDATFKASSVVQYNDVIYFLSIPGGAAPLAKWSPTVAFATISPANLNTMMGADKGGGNLAIFKERLFIVPGYNKTANQSSLIFSDAGNPEAYAATTQFINVHPGDGQRLMDLVTYNDNLVLFKNDSTYVLSYTSKPSDAELLNINTTIGATTRHCIVSYENSVFVYHEGFIYEMSNYDFQRINVKVPLFYDATAPSTRAEEVFLCLFGDRLVVRYYNRIYVYGLRTRTWSRWESANSELHNFGPIVAMPSNVVSATNDEFYAGSAILSNERVYLIKNGFSTTDSEKLAGVAVSMNCSITTKNYDLSNSYQYKKLNWWGADVITNNSVTGIANPIIFGFVSTWGLLYGQSKKWTDLATWANPLTSSSVSTVVTASGSGTLRRFLKFPKALRYRQINFQLQLTTSGATTDGPVKIFSLTIFTSTKETVTQAVN